MGQRVRRDQEFTACSICRAPIPLDGSWALGICPGCHADQVAEEQLDHAPDPFDDPDYDPLDRLYEPDYSDCYQHADGSCGAAGSEHCDWDCPVKFPRKRY